jgi:mitochondrial chaperone BCS1
VLSSNEKLEVLNDINEYLHPRTPRWYASRGIPLRRGYLFHGPPGTGKTSFSFAIAGVFGIDIYVISLQDASVTEEDLAILFTRLPRRCIVLLEDIDTAGLRRTDEGSGNEDDEKVDNKSEDKDKERGQKVKAKEVKMNGEVATNGKSTKKEKASKTQDSDSDDSNSEDSAEDRKSRKKRKMKKRKMNSGSDKVVSPDSISLSGLLNAIDGVASHEGRVLIMTTNKPESLDDALVRPGRVDRQVAFAHASSEQAGELFHRMYEAPSSRSSQKVEGLSPSSQAPQANGKLLPGPKVVEEVSNDVEGSVSAEELKGLSEEFSRAIPKGTLSPAEIQGFLLKRKRSPRKALAEVKDWIDATIKQKESKSKVSTVQ